MALSKFPAFGAHLGANQITETENIEETELNIGEYNYQFIRSKTKECSIIFQDCSWGMQVINDLIIDSAVFRIADEIEPEYVPAQPQGQNMEVDPNQPLIKLSCCKIQKVNASLKIEGKGNPNYKIGDTAYPVLQCAIGDFDLTPIVDEFVQEIAAFNSEIKFKIVSFHVNESEDQWQKFSVEFRMTVTNPNNPTSFALNYVNTYLQDEVPCVSDYENECKSYEISWEMSSSGYTRTIGVVKLYPMIR